MVEKKQSTKSKIIPLVPDDANDEQYDPRVAFEYHLFMAGRLASDFECQLMALYSYDDEMPVYSLDNINDDTAVGKMARVFTKSVDL